MPIEIDIAKVAKLAQLDLPQHLLDQYQAQLGDILDHAARVQALPTEGVEPTHHPLPMVNGFRPDEVTGSLDRTEVLEAAPEAEDGFFRVPPMLGEAP